MQPHSWVLCQRTPAKANEDAGIQGGRSEDEAVTTRVARCFESTG